jgi:hypothetical protein
VLLGASNLSRGVSTAVELARHWGSPHSEILAAMGHGRSFGLTTRLLGRTLPGILQSGLWNRLIEVPAEETVALATDVGNDLMYEAPIESVVGWIEQCLDRLAAASARTVVSRLPLANIGSLGERRFRVVRSILFPCCGLSLAEVRRRAEALDQGLCRAAEARGMTVVEPRAAWYGFDPIHVRRRDYPAAWNCYMAPWFGDRPMPRVRGSMRRFVYLRRLAPLSRSWFGIEDGRPQPSGKLADGTAIGFY